MYFIHSHKVFIGSLILVVISWNLPAQVNYYSSLYFLNDTLVGIPHNSLGAKLFRVLPNFSRDDHNQQIILDSNSYSEIEYGFSPGSIQFLRGSITRPINSKTQFNLSYQRNSSPGWVQRSKSKSTDFNFRLNKMISERISVSISSGFKSLNREQNGGLIKGEYYFNESLGGNLSLINNNINLVNAYSENKFGEVGAKGAYRLKESKKICSGLVLNTKGFNQLFQYVDRSPDSNYYSNFYYTANSEIKDSARLYGIDYGGQYFFNFSGDSEQTIFSRIGVKQQVGEYHQNGRSLTFQNTFIGSHFAFVINSNALKVDATVIPIGANRGENNIEVSLKRIFVKDSNRSERFSIVASGGTQKIFPGYIYSSYYSSLDSNNLMAKLVSTKKIDFGLMYFGKNVSSALHGGIVARNNSTFINSDGGVFQYTNEIALAQVLLHNALIIKRWDIDVSSVYQQNLKSRIYSLPRWNHHGSVAFKFKMFHHNLNAKLGSSFIFFSHYRARGYLPWFDQFYIQNDQEFGNYLQIDAFISTELKGVIAEFKVNNLSYGYVNQGPIISPYYPCLPRYLNVLVRWSFRN